MSSPEGWALKPGAYPLVVGLRGVKPMSLEFVLRIVGMFVLGISGGYLGATLSQLAGGPPELWISVFALVGALVGLVVAPFITTRPARSVRASMNQVSAQTMIAGVAGLIVGVLMGTLVAFPLSLLPDPLGQLLPFLGAVAFSYLGVAVFVMRPH